MNIRVTTNETSLKFRVQQGKRTRKSYPILGKDKESQAAVLALPDAFISNHLRKAINIASMRYWRKSDGCIELYHKFMQKYLQATRIQQESLMSLRTELAHAVDYGDINKAREIIAQIRAKSPATPAWWHASCYKGSVNHN